MSQPVFKKTSVILLVAFAMFGLLDSMACQLPVFRYALERWPAYPFKIYVYNYGKLNPELDKALTSLPKRDATSGPALNAMIQVVDLDAPMDDIAKEYWESQKNPELPWTVAAFPPPDMSPDPAWTGKLTLDNIRLLVDSPARREIASRLLNGESAVWVLVEAGDAQAAQAASQEIETQLKSLESTLQLPVIDKSIPSSRMDSSLPLAISFSVIRIRADDPEEKLFLRILRQSSRAKPTQDKNMVAYPIYGRGRSYGAQTAENLVPEAIAKTCSFLVGSCSCVAKNENPGVDLLIAANWESVLFGRMEVNVGLSPLSGLMPVAVVTDETKPTAFQRIPAMKEQKTNKLIRNTAVVLGGAVVLVVGGVFILRRRSNL